MYGGFVKETQKKTYNNQ